MIMPVPCDQKYRVKDLDSERTKRSHGRTFRLVAVAFVKWAADDEATRRRRSDDPSVKYVQTHMNWATEVGDYVTERASNRHYRWSELDGFAPPDGRPFVPDPFLVWKRVA